MKCHLINAASAQSNAMQKITNAHIKIFEVAQSLQGFPSRKRTKGKKTAYIIAKFKEININALLASLSKLTASTEVENQHTIWFN